MKPEQIHSVPLLLCLPLLLLNVGCRVLQTAAKVPEEALHPVAPEKRDNQKWDPVDVQQKLFRFADEFLTRMSIGIDQLRRGTNALAPAEVLQWKIAIGTKTCAIASDPNAVAGLLDMTVFVSATRAAVEAQWQPNIFGQSAQPILASCRDSDTSIWNITASVLTTEQQAELRAAIDAWCRENPPRESVLAAGSCGFTMRVAQAGKAGTSEPSSVFGLLMVDPLSSLEPATREIAQIRLLADRALYVAQGMPTLLRWQAELLSLNAVAMPEVQHLVSNSTQISASVERFAALAEKLPGQVTAEREAFVNDLETQERQLTPLVDRVRQALTAGTQMSMSLHTTLATFDTLMKRFGVGETNTAMPPDTNAEPFRILDYAQTASRMESMARQLTELVQTLDQTLGDTNLARLSAQVAPAVQQAQAGGKEIVDYALWKGTLAMAIALVFALIYRFLGPRLTPAKRSATNSP